MDTNYDKLEQVDISSETVSYTHLDVYKRQVKNMRSKKPLRSDR